MDDKLVNQATQLFIGDGKTNLSHLEFNTWYHPDICHYLLQLVPNKVKFIRVIFHDTGDGNNTTTFKKQLQELILLSNCLDRPALFIGKEPGAENHFIAGIVRNGQLLFINPLGATQHSDCYQTFAELIREKILAGLWFSINALQQPDYEEKKLVSRGAIALELAIHVLTMFTPDSFNLFWNQLKINQPKHLITSSELLFSEMDIQDLLPSSLKEVQHALGSEIYKNILCNIRQHHYQYLQMLPVEYATNNNVSIHDYLQTCKNPPSQVLFNALITADKTITNIDQIPEYKRLKDELDINVIDITSSISNESVTGSNPQINKGNENKPDLVVSIKPIMQAQLQKYELFINEIKGTQEAIDKLISHANLKARIVQELENISKELEKAKTHAGDTNERIRLAAQTTYDGCINKLSYLKTIIAQEKGYPVDELNRVCSYLEDIVNKVSPKIELHTYSVTQMQEVQAQGLFFTQRHLHNALNEKSSLGKDFTALLETIKTTMGSHRYSCFISYAKPIDENNGPDCFTQSFLETLRDHLLLAGFNPLLDFKCTEAGENIEAYMKQSLISNYWLLIGTPSLLKRLTQQAHVAFETRMETLRKVNKLNNIYPMIPLLVIGNAAQSLPWHKQDDNFIDLTQSSYLAGLKTLLLALSRIPEQHYNELWKAFEAKYPEHMQALSKSLIERILQNEKEDEQLRNAKITDKQADAYQAFPQARTNGEIRKSISCFFPVPGVQILQFNNMDQLQKKQLNIKNENKNSDKIFNILNIFIQSERNYDINLKKLILQLKDDIHPFLAEFKSIFTPSGDLALKSILNNKCLSNLQAFYECFIEPFLLDTTYINNLKSSSGSPWEVLIPQTEGSNTHLINAIIDGDINTVNSSLANPDINVNSPRTKLFQEYSSYSPLMIATSEGNFEIVKLLAKDARTNLEQSSFAIYSNKTADYHAFNKYTKTKLPVFALIGQYLLVMRDLHKFKKQKIETEIPALVKKFELYLTAYEKYDKEKLAITKKY